MAGAKADKRRSAGPAVMRELFFDLPYGMEPPVLTHDTLGITEWSLRASESYRMSVTLLDTPDFRLVRAGVLLAHRVLDGIGEWYLAAPAWAPQLPSERVEVMDDDDLPLELAELVRPFRRRAPLGPVAALTCRRAVFLGRTRDDSNDEGATLGTLRDDRVTIRRGGIATSRYREVTLTPTSVCTPAQLTWLSETLQAAGASPLSALPALAQRLGPPATGLTDFPVPRRWDASVSLEGFVSALLATRLRELVDADLALRAGMAPAEPLFAAVEHLRTELRGLAAMFEPSWLREVEADVAAIAGDDRNITTTSQLGERYAVLLDQLVSASRAPRLGDLSQRPARDVLREEVAASMAIVVSRCQALTARSEQQAWRAARSAAEQVRTMVTVAALLDDGGAGAKIGKAVSRLVQALDECLARPITVADDVVVEPGEGTAVIGGSLDPAAAFEAGRAYEREVTRVAHARADFVERWPRREAKLTRRSRGR